MKPSAQPLGVSGLGKFHTNGPNSKKPKPLKPLCVAHLQALVDVPQEDVPKDRAQWLIPSSLESRKHKEQHESGQFWALWFDLDVNSPGVERVAALLETWLHGADYEVYTTASATAENPKLRGVIPLSRSLSGGDWMLCQTAINDRLKAEGITPDESNEGCGQLLYLPNRGAHYDTASRREGHYLDAMAILKADIDRIRANVERAEADTARRRKAATERREAGLSASADGQSVIDQFNAVYPVEEILIRAGYEQHGQTFRHPMSESGSFSATVKNGRVHSLSSADPLYTEGAGVGAHDAFSAFKVLVHANNEKAAVKDAAKLLNADAVNREPNSRREYRQQQQPTAQAADEALDTRISVRDDEGKLKSQSTLLIEIAERWRHFHDDDVAYGVIHLDGIRQVWPTRSDSYRRILSKEFMKLTGKGCNRNSISEALDTIEAKAIHYGESIPVHVRVARFADRLYLDMGCEQWRVIEIGADGWRILEQSPVMFVRKKGMMAYPEPDRAGDLQALYDLVNVDQNDRPLLIGWMLGALRGWSPYPVLVLQGEHGTGKSTLSMIIRRFIDPSTVPLRSPPKEVKDLCVAAMNVHAVCLDNLSGINNDLSDCLCRFSTGGGIEGRKLYTDGESVLYQIAKPVLVNGIDDIATRPDLASRAIVLHLHTIPDGSRKTAASVDRDLNDKAGTIMGGILNALVSALRYESEVSLPRLPRMADFAVWVSAAEMGGSLPWGQGEFLRALDAMHDEATMDGIHASPIASALLEIMSSKAPANTLKVRPTQLANDIRSKTAMPSLSAKYLKSELTRLAPSLRAIGLTFTTDRTGVERNYIVTYNQSCRVAEKPSQPSQPSQPRNGAASSHNASVTDLSSVTLPSVTVTDQITDLSCLKATADAGYDTCDGYDTSSATLHDGEGVI